MGEQSIQVTSEIEIVCVVEGSGIFIEPKWLIGRIPVLLSSSTYLCSRLYKWRRNEIFR